MTYEHTKTFLRAWLVIRTRGAEWVLLAVDSSYWPKGLIVKVSSCQSLAKVAGALTKTEYVLVNDELRDPVSD